MTTMFKIEIMKDYIIWLKKKQLSNKKLRMKVTIPNSHSIDSLQYHFLRGKKKRRKKGVRAAILKLLDIIFHWPDISKITQ